MSYWCGFEEGGPDSINMTSNCVPMWTLAGANLAALNGKPAGEVKLTLATAVRSMLAEPWKYRALNPPNGWGDYESCVKYLVELAIMCGLVESDWTFYAHH